MHKILERQLKRIGLDVDTLPPTLELWSDFLMRVNRFYDEADKERYMLQRTMEISSRELLDLNKMLEHAQHIALLGYWYLTSNPQEIIVSKELRLILGLELNDPIPPIELFMAKIHEEDLPKIQERIKTVASAEAPFSEEFRYLHPDGTYHWYYASGQAYPNMRGHISGIIMDITERKQAEMEVDYLHKQLMLSARQAGMADIAKSILHNVGNVLNSVSVSLEILKEALDRSKCHKFKELTDLIQGHMTNMSYYLSEDPKGSLIPQYMIALSHNMNNEFKICKQEIENLNLFTNHIKEIVVSQNAMHGAPKITEVTSTVELVKWALQMSGITPGSENNITVERCLDFDAVVHTDKTKVLQILVNLLQNAKDSIVLDKDLKDKKMIIRTEEVAHKNQFKIIVQDNGQGIEPENITKIFSFGFTTKDNGHGFGLHASALAADEMGGTLRAESDGVGKGAKFTLTLPIDIRTERLKNE